MSERSVILVVEDSDEDVMLLRRAFQKAGILNPLFILRSGAQAIEYLQGLGRFSNRAEYPLPDLMLLDVSMPGLDGFDVLAWIGTQPSLRALRTVVLTSSERVWDISRAYDLGAKSFLVKPVDFEDFLNLIKALYRYWISFDKAPFLDRASESKEHKPDS